LEESLQLTENSNINDEQPPQSVDIANAIWARLYGDIGSQYELVFSNSSTKRIQIGMTGVYEFSLQDNTLIKVTLIKQSQ
jgi:hypothetical protein